ncbi:uncharacterized protein [Eucyclogobius newberryi]|uniref:uncharacterized protein isoform X2 n=1 Tax=Eucyclogobius newberryi TaxID=166745 RepID=UPI003B5C48D4
MSMVRMPRSARSQRSVTEPQPQDTEPEELVPGRLTRTSWTEMLAQEEAEEAVAEHMEKLLRNVMDGCCRADVRQQVFPFTTNWVKKCLIQTVEQRFLCRDDGDGAEEVLPEDCEPPPAEADAWAQGCVPLVRPSPPLPPISPKLAARGKKVGPAVSTAVETSSSSDAPAVEPCEPALPSSSSPPAISMTAALHNVGAMASLKETAAESEDALAAQRDVEANSNTNVAPENNLEIEDLEETVNDDEQSEPEDAYEDEYWMERLLQEEGELMGAEIGGGDFFLDPFEVPQQQRNNPGFTEEMDLVAVDDDEEEEEEYEEEEAEEDDAEEEETEEEETEEEETEEEINEEYESEPVLIRVRNFLVERMGFEKFTEVYNNLKALIVEEDENLLNLSPTLVLSIFGPEHQDLFMSTRHLVLCDWAVRRDDPFDNDV